MLEFLFKFLLFSLNPSSHLLFFYFSLLARICFFSLQFSDFNDIFEPSRKTYSLQLQFVSNSDLIIILSDTKFTLTSLTYKRIFNIFLQIYFCSRPQSRLFLCSPYFYFDRARKKKRQYKFFLYHILIKICEFLSTSEKRILV